MKKYIGTKLITAVAMTRIAYNELRGWDLPEDENGDDEGFLTEVIGGFKNTEQYDGYIQWLPTASFNFEYRPINNMPFGLAIEALKQGKKVNRVGWYNESLFLFLAQGIGFKTDADLEGASSVSENLVHKSIVLKTADDEFVVGWQISQTDMLAEDWLIV